MNKRNFIVKVFSALFALCFSLGTVCVSFGQDVPSPPNPIVPTPAKPVPWVLLPQGQPLITPPVPSSMEWDGTNIWLTGKDGTRGTIFSGNAPSNFNTTVTFGSSGILDFTSGSVINFADGSVWKSTGLVFGSGTALSFPDGSAWGSGGLTFGTTGTETLPDGSTWKSTGLTFGTTGTEKLPDGSTWSNTGLLGATITKSTINGSLNVVLYGADPTGTTDSSTAIQNAMNAAVSNGFESVYFPPGKYLTNTTIDWSPYVQGWTDGSVLWETTSTTNTALIIIDTKYGNTTNGETQTVFDGNFEFFQNTTNANLACFYIGDATGGSGYGATWINLKNIEIKDFSYGVQFGNQTYGITFDHVYFRLNSIVFYTVANLANFGEKITCFDCVFDTDSEIASLNSPGEFIFLGGSFDYMGSWSSNITGSNLKFIGSHFEWNSANTLFNYGSSGANTYVSFVNILFNFTGSTAATPLICTIGLNALLDINHNIYALPITGITLYNISASTGIFVGPVSETLFYTNKAPGTYVGNSGSGTIHNF